MLIIKELIDLTVDSIPYILPSLFIGFVAYATWNGPGIDSEDDDDE